MYTYKAVWICGRSSVVEHNLAKVGVDGSNPFARSISKLIFQTYGWCQYARVVELVDTGDLKSPGHCDRAGSSPAPGTILTVANTLNYFRDLFTCSE